MCGIVITVGWGHILSKPLNDWVYSVILYNNAYCTDKLEYTDEGHSPDNVYGLLCQLTTLQVCVK